MLKSLDSGALTRNKDPRALHQDMEECLHPQVQSEALGLAQLHWVDVFSKPVLRVRES